MRKEFLEAGKVVATHGVKGELRVEPWCDSAGFLTKLKTFYLDAGKTAVPVENSRAHKNLLLVKLKGIDSATQGDLMRGKILYLKRTDVTLPKGRYFIQDLLGMRVENADTSENYGIISDVFSTGANDVYEITGANGAKYLFPAVSEMINTINLETNIMTIRPIRGIFDNAD